LLIFFSSLLCFNYFLFHFSFRISSIFFVFLLHSVLCLVLLLFFFSFVMNSTQLCTLNEMEIHAINIYFLEIISYCLFWCHGFLDNFWIFFLTHSFLIKCDVKNSCDKKNLYSCIDGNWKKFLEVFVYFTVVSFLLFKVREFLRSQNIFRTFRILCQLFCYFLFIYLCKLIPPRSKLFKCLSIRILWVYHKAFKFAMLKEWQNLISIFWKSHKNLKND